MSAVKTATSGRLGAAIFCQHQAELVEHFLLICTHMMNVQYICWLARLAGAAGLCLATPVLGADLPRMADGTPDLSGTYDITTATPVQRAPELGNQRAFTAEQVQRLIDGRAAFQARGSAPSDPNRAPPPAGGNVGSYNTFYFDFGNAPFQINGEYPTSVIQQPANGRKPEMTEAARLRAARYDRSVFRQDGAWWLDIDGPGPFDGPESFTIVDRCLVGRGVPGGPPVLPTIYNNMKRIVQTKDHVMILIEMVHDARVVRLNSSHAPPEMRFRAGDSIGWWEGDTLVVDTTNFKDTPALEGASRNLHVVERFQPVNADTLLYSFTVNDPAAFAEPWGGTYPWPRSSERVYEYACHEGNYALVNMLKGARRLEREAAERSE